MKKGFTLIELLAVIVILAIIATIATPIVLSIINDTKDSATFRSAEYYLEAVEQSIAKKSMNIGSSYRPNLCLVQENGNLLCDDKDTLEIEVNGKKPSNGTITFEDNKIHEVKDLKFENMYVNVDSEGNISVSNEVLITSLQVSYQNCLEYFNDDTMWMYMITDTCIPEIKIEPKAATNKTLKFTLDEYYYGNCSYEDGSKYKSSFNGEVLLNSSTGELNKIKDWFFIVGSTYTYITVETTDGSNISEKIKVTGAVNAAYCMDYYP